MIPRSLRARVTVVGVVTLALVLGIGAWVTVRAVAAGLRSDITAQNEEVLDALSNAISGGARADTLLVPIGADGTEFLILDSDDLLVNSSAFPAFFPGDDTTLVPLSDDPDEVLVFEAQAPGSPLVDGELVIADDDTVIADDGTAVADVQALPDELIGEWFVLGDEEEAVDAGDWFETRRTVTGPDDERFTLVAFSPVGVVSSGVDRLAIAMLIIVPLLVALGGFALWMAIGTALVPVHRITEEANRIAPSTSGDRLPVPESGDEIAELTATLNGMLDRLDAGLIRQRQFVSDASHELRSPLTAVRGAAELLASDGSLSPESEPSLAALRRGAERLEVVLDDLTRLASAGGPLERREVDLADLVQDEVLAIQQPTPAVTVDTSRVTPATGLANPVQLARAVNNLLANALRHADRRVEVGAEVQDGRIVIIVDDDGPGVPPADRKRIFDRFVRLDDDRSRHTGGSGLGLAIVASIVADHGGTVTCTSAPLGGARFTVRL